MRAESHEMADRARAGGEAGAGMGAGGRTAAQDANRASRAAGKE